MKVMKFLKPDGTGAEIRGPVPPIGGAVEVDGEIYVRDDITHTRDELMNGELAQLAYLILRDPTPAEAERYRAEAARRAELVEVARAAMARRAAEQKAREAAELARHEQSAAESRAAVQRILQSGRYSIRLTADLDRRVCGCGSALGTFAVERNSELLFCVECARPRCPELVGLIERGEA